MNATATANFFLLLWAMGPLVHKRGAFLDLMRKHHSQHDKKSVLPLPFLQQPHRPEGVFFEGVFCFFEAEEVSFSSATLGGGLGGGELFAAGPETTRPLR